MIRTILGGFKNANQKILFLIYKLKSYRMKRATIVLAAFTATMALSCQKEMQKTQQQSSTTSLSIADYVGDVYTQSNTDTNRVFHFKRASDGKLTLEGKYATHGKGAGNFALHSQGSVLLSDNKKWLFVVNAKSSDITVFNVSNGKPEMVDKASSHGKTPISLAAHGKWLYVLNVGSDFKGSIAGFTVADNGHLTYIENSSKNLGTVETDPAEISFNKNGTVLIITERKTNEIVTYTVDEQGVPSNKKIVETAVSEPFGFAMDDAGYMYVSGASRGAKNLGTLSSYQVNSNGKVTGMDTLQRSFQTASCWVVLTGDYKFAYVSNTGSNTISGYSVNNGNLNLLNSDGITAATGLAPQDEAITSDSKYLYVLNQGEKTISGYSINASSGALSKVVKIGGLSHKAQGLAAK